MTLHSDGRDYQVISRTPGGGKTVRVRDVNPAAARQLTSSARRAARLQGGPDTSQIDFAEPVVAQAPGGPQVSVAAPAPAPAPAPTPATPQVIIREVTREPDIRGNGASADSNASGEWYPEAWLPELRAANRRGQGIQHEGVAG